MINSGHTRDAAFVLRAPPGGGAPVRLSTWAPVAIAMIGKPPATVLDRSIEIPMRRRAGETIEPLKRREAAALFEPWRRKAARWAADAAESLREARPLPAAGLDDRAADNWEPLLAIAEVAGGEWPALAREAAAALSRSRGEEDDLATLLLADIRSLFHRRPDGSVSVEPLADRLPTSRLLEGLHALEERPWREADRGRSLGPRGLTRLLKPFGIEPASILLGPSTVVRGYTLRAFADAFSRYLSPLESATALHAWPATTCGIETGPASAP
ncbi:MAG: DUF3631 domain-containing protein [Planctomycetes bacterium]|nr:DUF3631 domain-containing protein [Planctomycetota bacterium]